MAQNSLSVTKTSAAANVSTLGAADWAVWNGTTASLTPNQRKSGGGSQISSSLFGGGAVGFYLGDPRTISWTSDGTPTASGSSDGGIYSPISGTGIGFGVQAIFPASTTTRRAWVYVGYYDAVVARVTSILSDGSVGNQVDSTTLTGSAATSFDGYVVVDYAAASAGQTLTVRIEVLTEFTGGNATLQAAAFADIAPIITVQPTNQSTNSGSTATFTALASGSGGTITYQWQDNRTGSFTNVASGGTSASYTTPNTDATYQGRSYRVVATDSNGSVTSGTAQLNVLGLPVYLWSTSVQAGNDVWLRNPLAAGAAGALSGASALTFSQSAVLEGSGALFGTSPLAFTQAGAISGIAALTATSTLTFTQSGAIAGILAASGTAALTFTQSGVIAGAGVLSGTSPLAFTQSGTLIGNAPITGTSALTFSQSGSISGVGSLSGTSALVFTQSGTLSSLASGSISGTSSLTFSASASIAGSGALVGSSGLTFSQSASLTGTAPVTGSAALAFSPVAVIVGSGALTGTADLVFSVSGTLGQADASALVGSASLLFTASGNLLGSGGEQFTGGFFYAFERERAKREKARRKRLEDEEEASRLKSEVDREIARLLLAQEAKAAQREEMARLTTLVEQAAKIRTRDAFNARVNAALERATQKATISALLTFEREVQRQMDAEDSAVLLMLLND